MDALKLLTADHNRVRGLFARFTTAEEAGDVQDDDHAHAGDRPGLEVHTDIEETVFYPWARDLSEEIAEVVDEGIEEHHVVKVLLGEIGELEPGADEWVAKAKVLMENVDTTPPRRSRRCSRRSAPAATTSTRWRTPRGPQGQLGAPVLADKQHLTNEQLRELATEQEIPGRSSMDRDELAATVSPS